MSVLQTQPLPAVTCLHLFKETRREMGAVGLGRGMGRHGRGVLQNRLQHLDVLRGRRHHLPRMFSQPQAKLQLIPRLLPLWPFRQFIHPGRVKLRPAQTRRIMRRKHLRNRAIRPQHPQRLAEASAKDTSDTTVTVPYRRVSLRASSAGSHHRRPSLTRPPGAGCHPSQFRGRGVEGVDQPEAARPIRPPPHRPCPRRG